MPTSGTRVTVGRQVGCDFDRDEPRTSHVRREASAINERVIHRTLQRKIPDSLEFNVISEGEFRVHERVRKNHRLPFRGGCDLR